MKMRKHKPSGGATNFLRWCKCRRELTRHELTGTLDRGTFRCISCGVTKPFEFEREAA